MDQDDGLDVEQLAAVAASTLLSKLLAQGRKTAPDPLHDTVQDS